MMSWPSRAEEVRPGINDTWNLYQQFCKGKKASVHQWKEARAKLHRQCLDRGPQLLKELAKFKRPKSTLTVEQVIEIYKYREIGMKGRLGIIVSKTYGVTSKAAP
mmetsp:Transcript_44107/g.117666  ORF Transcript_44107/g.117666 Transcript_44107/m.117666 type:complete len:105 (+) Transcript_44107:28-342(+)